MVNIAVIGCGYWGPNLIRNFMSSPDAELVCVCDLDEKRLADVLRPYPAVAQVNCLDDVIKDPSVDAVAIATPVATHFEIAKTCLDNGKHVLLEKPLAAKVSEGEELVELAKAKNLTLMCDHTFCYTGAVRKIKEIVDSGTFGDVLYYDSVRINLGLFQSDVNVIWDLATHDLAIVDFLLDEKPVLVSAHGVSHASNGIENIAYVVLEYPGNLIAHFHVNWLSPVKIRKTIIGGSNKMIEWNDLVPGEKIKVYDSGVELSKIEQEQKTKLLVSYRSGDIYSPRLDNTEALAMVVSEFAECVESGRTPLTDGVSALRVLRILEAAEHSIKSGGTVIPVKY